jgi:hypothetical protein
MRSDRAKAGIVGRGCCFEGLLSAECDIPQISGNVLVAATPVVRNEQLGRIAKYHSAFYVL